MAQKAFVLVIEMRRRRRAVTSQQTGCRLGEVQATMSPWPRRLGPAELYLPRGLVILSHPSAALLAQRSIHQCLPSPGSPDN